MHIYMNMYMYTCIHICILYLDACFYRWRDEIQQAGVTKYNSRRSSKRLHTHARPRTHKHTHTHTHTLVQDDENHDDDIGDAVDAKTPTPAQKLAALDWTPWPTRVQPVESTTRYIQFIFMKPHMSIYTYVYKCIYVHTYI